MDEDERASKDALENLNTLETLRAENFELTVQIKRNKINEIEIGNYSASPPIYCFVLFFFLNLLALFDKLYP